MSDPCRSPEPRSELASLPYARGIVALDPQVFAELRRCVALLFAVSRTPAWQDAVDADAGPVARHRVANTGVFMGYDFHVTPAGPRLIEINTNAGGALANGLHTAQRVDPARLACLCDEVLPVEAIESRIVATFRSEFEAVHPERRLRRLAIADEQPLSQFLYPEFQLLAGLFERAGIEAAIVDTAELRREAGGIAAGGGRVDLVYLRDTDFQLAAPRSRALREAWLADEVVVTPSPREHHLLADKRRLGLFSSAEHLRALGVAAQDAAFLARIVPETHGLEELGAEAAWRTRHEWVFKPSAAHGSRGVYRGDKISRRRFDAIFSAGGFVAQRAVAPGEVEVPTSEGPRRMKFDVRAYAYRDEILLLGARVYQGQVTNLRTPGGGFSAICVVRRGG